MSSTLSRRCRLAALALLTSLLAPGAARGADSALVAVRFEPEGRLLRVRMLAQPTIGDYTLARQGPPEQRDLVVRFADMANRVVGPVDPGDYLLPVAVVPDDSTTPGGLKVVLGGVGDSLVQVAQRPGELSVLIIPPETRSEAAQAYRIGPNDTLQIDVFGHEDMSKTLKVSPRGLINFPLIGNIRAADRTVDEVAAEITERLAADYIQDPHVTVSIWEYLSQWVNVIGEVAQPGRYYMTGPTRLVDALSQAGGLTENVGREILVSRQPDQIDPAAAGDVFRIDVARLLSVEGGSLNLPLRPGDIVNVLGRPEEAGKR